MPQFDKFMSTCLRMVQSYKETWISQRTVTKNGDVNEKYTRVLRKAHQNLKTEVSISLYSSNKNPQGVKINIH